MIQHTPLQQPRHAPNPACRDPGAPRPTGSPITYLTHNIRVLNCEFDNDVCAHADTPQLLVMICALDLRY